MASCLKAFHHGLGMAIASDDNHKQKPYGVRLDIEDLSDAGPQVLGLCHGVHHRHDGLVHWCHGPALLDTAGSSGGGGGDPRRPTLLAILV